MKQSILLRSRTPAPRLRHPVSGFAGMLITGWIFFLTLYPYAAHSEPGTTSLLRIHGGASSSLLQSGSYQSGSYTLSAALGEIPISGLPLVFRNMPRQGGSFSLYTGTAVNSIRISTFAAANETIAAVNGSAERTKSEGLLAGVSGELSFFNERAHFRTSFLTGNETSEQIGRGRAVQSKQGNTSRIYTLIDPFAGKLVTDTEVVFAALDDNRHDYSAALHRATYKFGIGGKTVIAGIPLDLEYRKSVTTVSSNQGGVGPNSRDADTVSGGGRYLKGPLELGIKTTYFQQYNRTLHKKESTATSFTLSPRLQLGEHLITSSIAVKRHCALPANLRTDTLGLDLGTSGRLPEQRLDYELRGSFVHSDSGSSTSKHSVTSNIKIPAPFFGFFTLLNSPSLGIKGEYSRVNKNPSPLGRNHFSLLFTLSSV